MIKIGAEGLGIKEEIRRFLADSLGNGAFGLFKKYRDAIIHARIINHLAGIGEHIESKGHHVEVLLTAQALNTFCDHITALRFELNALLAVLLEAALPTPLAYESDPKKSQRESKIQEYFAQAQKFRHQRLSLPPIPEFPSESELNAEDAQAMRDNSIELPD